MNPQQQLDPSIVALTKAIGHQESGGDYNKIGDNGYSMGAYQWNNKTPLQKGEIPANFKSYATEVGADPNDFSPENQDKVAYSTVQKWGQQGLSPAQIASKWNSGDPEAYKTAKPGFNQAEGVSYDVGSYVNNVAKYYEQFKGGDTQQKDSSGYVTSAAPLPQDEQQPTTQDQSLGSELSQRGQDLSSAVSNTATGKIQPISGVLQGAGAIAGGLGDITNKGLELIPGVKQVEGLIGQGVGTLAQTPVGQAVAKSIQDFSTAHPELAKDIGAGFNIVTAIPILKGLGTVGKLGMEAGSQALKGIAEKSFTAGAPDLIASTKAGTTFLTKNPTVIQDMLDRRLVGDIKGGEYVTDKAIGATIKTIGNLNSKVGTILANPIYSSVSQDGEAIAKRAIEGFTDRNGNVIEGLPQSGLTPNELIANAKKLDSTNKLLWDKFEAGQANLKEINELRSSLDKKVKKVYLQGIGLDQPDVATSKELGANLAGSMRDAVQSIAPETQPLFKEMTTQFNIEKALGLMNGKKVIPGTLAKLAGQTIGVGTGATVGGLVGGVPGAIGGGLIGENTAGAIANKLAGKNLVQGILKRTGKNAIKTSAKGVTGLLGAPVQKVNR